MAVAVEVVVEEASQEAIAAMDGAVVARMGEPPRGLLAHAVVADDRGARLVEVWRAQADAESFHRDVVRPATASVGLALGEPVVRPVWNLAIPPGDA